MKRKILAMLLAVIMVIPAFGIITHAQPQIGQRAGDVLNTDIRVFLNGIPIMGYNIGGWTYIVAEDLPAYGKNVVWNPAARTLNITMGGGSAMTPRPVPENFAPTGSIAFPFVYTDIVTYIAGNRVTSYNIQGQTVIRIDDLVAAFGVSHWDSARRELLVATDGQGPRRSQAPPQPQRNFAGLLSARQHSDFATGGNRELFLIEGGYIRGHQNQLHSNGILMDTGNSTTWGGVSGHGHIQFQLQRQYETLTGTAVRPRNVNVLGRAQANNMTSAGSYTVIFRGDGREIHRIANVTAFIPMDFSINVNNIYTLQITVVRHGDAGTILALTDLRLYN